MPYKKYVWMIAITALLLSSCTMSYPGGDASTAPTSKPFATSVGGSEMEQLQNYATSTALAKTAIAGGGPTATATPSTGSVNPTATNTPAASGNMIPTATNTPVAGVIVPSNTPGMGGSGGGTTPTVAVQTGRPAQYTLQQGEFVFCIARRFNVDPNDILSLNGLFDSETIYPGTVLKIPQSGSFPGERALRSHPASYTVTGNNDTTLYGVACVFGDVDPAAIAQRNSLSLSVILSIGQVLNIP